MSIYDTIITPEAFMDQRRAEQESKRSRAVESSLADLWATIERDYGTKTWVLQVMMTESKPYLKDAADYLRRLGWRVDIYLDQPNETSAPLYVVVISDHEVSEKAVAKYMNRVMPRLNL